MEEFINAKKNYSSLDVEGGKIHKHEYDKIMDVDEVEDYINKKLINKQLNRK